VLTGTYCSLTSQSKAVSHLPPSLAVASYLKALEDLKKAEDAVERLKNHAADSNQQLPKSENIQQDLNSAKETAQKAEIQQKGGGELSQKDLDTLHAAIDQAYKSAKEQGLIKDPLDLQKVGTKLALALLWF
jgi:hypothetical protein